MNRTAIFPPGGKGRFGPYGGQFVPETLMPCLEELECTWLAARADAAFADELIDFAVNRNNGPPLRDIQPEFFGE